MPRQSSNKLIIKWRIANVNKNTVVKTSKLEYKFPRNEFALFLMGLPKDHDILDEIRSAMRIIDEDKNV